MNIRARQLAGLSLWICTLICAPAQAALTRCEDTAGKVTYMQGECPGGTRAVREVSTSPAASSAEQRQAQQQSAAEARSAAQLKTEREKKERAEAAAERRAQAAASKRQQQCTKLKLHAQRLADQAQRATPAKQAQARQKAQRAADDYAARCQASR